MNENEFLTVILNKVAMESSGIATISTFDLEEFKIDDVTLFEKLNLITKSNPATHLVCYECDDNCFAPVSIYPENQFSPETIFMTCQNGMGRIPVNAHDLNQWQVSTRQIAQTVATLCGYSKAPTQKNGLWQIGLIEGKHAGMLCLDFYAEDGVQCVINEQRVPLVEVMIFNGTQYRLDIERLKKMATVGVQAQGKFSLQREIGKSKTQLQYTAWQEEYEEIKARHPEKTDTWIAKQIQKSDVANGRDWQTIKKNMKNN